MELERFWRTRQSWASVLFYTNRYLAVISNIPLVYEQFWEVSTSVGDRFIIMKPLMRLIYTLTEVLEFMFRVVVAHVLIKRQLSSTTILPRDHLPLNSRHGNS